MVNGIGDWRSSHFSRKLDDQIFYRFKNVWAINRKLIACR
ncbi:hypothetical protein C4J95_4580 [Pseudomonas orientalis]|nr:hypothetical protein C4J95_4580 [Pseudomonas orientalis]